MMLVDRHRQVIICWRERLGTSTAVAVLAQAAAAAVGQLTHLRMLPPALARCHNRGAADTAGTHTPEKFSSAVQHWQVTCGKSDQCAVRYQCWHQHL